MQFGDVFFFILKDNGCQTDEMVMTSLGKHNIENTK